MFTLSVSADDFFDNYTGIDQAWDGQKPITNQEFEKAIDTLTEKQKKKEAKINKRKIKKISGGGTSLHKNLEPTGEILKQDSVRNDDKYEGRLLNIPVEIIVEGKILPKGYYNVFGEKDKDNQVYISFYQSHSYLGKVKAYKTNNDFESDELNFVKISPYNDKYMKIMFGSLDFNAYTFVRYVNED